MNMPGCDKNPCTIQTSWSTSSLVSLDSRTSRGTPDERRCFLKGSLDSSECYWSFFDKTRACTDDTESSAHAWLLNRALYFALGALNVCDLARARTCSRAWNALIDTEFLRKKAFWSQVAYQGFGTAGRPAVWCYLASRATIKHGFDGVGGIGDTCDTYQELIAMNECQFDKDIRADTDRPTPGVENLEDPEVMQAWRTKLYNVLRAYALYDPEVGYCQGMNCIAAFILQTVRDESAAFQMLATVMGKLDARSLFTRDFSRLTTCLCQFDNLVSTCLPDVYALLTKHSLSIPLFCTEWFLTLFVPVCPPEVVARVWDIFLVDGWLIFYRLGLAILLQARDGLLREEPYRLLRYLQTISRQPTFDAENLLEVAASFRLSTLPPPVNQ